MRLRCTVAMIMFVSACGSSGEDSGAAEREQASFLELARQSESELVRQIVEDGIVSDIELEEAAIDLARCSESKGVDVAIEASQSEDGGFDFIVGGSASPEEQTDNEVAFEDCFDRLYNDLSAVYTLQNPISAGIQEQRNQSVTDCLNERGIPVEDWPASGEEIDPAVEAECFDAAVVAHPQE